MVKEPVEPMREKRYEAEQEEDPINKLARMIMQHEREQRENAMSRCDRLLSCVSKSIMPPKTKAKAQTKTRRVLAIDKYA